MQHMELCTPHDSLADAIRVFACSATRDGVSFVSEQAVAEGEWVAFRFLFGEGKLLLEGQGLCCEMESIGSPGAARFRVTLAALELDGENRMRHARLFEERMRDTAEHVLETSDVPTVRVARPVKTTPPEAPSASIGSVKANGRPRTITAVRPAERGADATRPAREDDPIDDSGLETCVQEVMLLAVKADTLDRASELLEKVTRVQGAYLGRPASMQALLEHALHLGLTVLDAQMSAYSRLA